MKGTFSSSHDMAEDVGNGGKLLGEQDSLVETWIVIGKSGLVQLLSESSPGLSNLTKEGGGRGSHNNNKSSI